MTVRNAERAVDRLFTFDDREWTREDLIACASRDTGDLLVRVLQELRVPGIGIADVQHGIINDDFWGAGYDDNVSSGKEIADSHRGAFGIWFVVFHSLRFFRRCWFFFSFPLTLS